MISVPGEAVKTGSVTVRGVFVGVGVAVFVAVLVGVKVGVNVGVFVGVFVDVRVGVFVGVFVGVDVAVAVGVDTDMVTLTGEDAMPLATTASVEAPSSMPAGTIMLVDTVAAPVATPIELWFCVFA